MKMYENIILWLYHDFLYHLTSGLGLYIIRPMRIFILFFIVWTLISSQVFAEASDNQKLRFLGTQFLHKFSEQEHISALAVTMKSPRQLEPISVYIGTKSINQQKRINANSLFQVGSITKSFISVILLKLESDKNNHFNLDDAITKYFPQYPRWHQVTIKQLMNMSSGISDYTRVPEIMESYARHPYANQSIKSWIANVYQKPLLFPPGEGYNYSNTNYILLGMLIEKLTGHTLSFEIKNRITIPYQLTHTYYGFDSSKEIFSNLVHGYQNEQGFSDLIPEGTDVTNYNLSYMGAAGGIISNSEDIAKWIQDLFTPGRILTENQFNKMTSIISQKTGRSVKHLSVNDPLGYGLGIRKQYSPIFKASYYIYQGMTLGYRTIYFYFPEKKSFVVITVNSSFDGKENHLIGLMNQIGGNLMV